MTLAPRLVGYRWVEVTPSTMPGDDRHLWKISFKNRQMLGGGRAWSDMVEYETLEGACAAAIQIDEAFEAFWRARSEESAARQNVYRVASEVSSTRLDGVTYRADRSPTT